MCFRKFSDPALGPEESIVALRKKAGRPLPRLFVTTSLKGSAPVGAVGVLARIIALDTSQGGINAAPLVGHEFNGSRHRQLASCSRNAGLAKGFSPR
jgi:hypothetical protein